VTTTRQFQPTKRVGGALSKSKQMAVQTKIPLQDPADADERQDSQVKRVKSGGDDECQHQD